jgi:hypothetical protein
MASLEDVQRQVAATVSGFPPTQQAELVRVFGLAYKAGFEACREEMARASKILTLGRVN